MKRLLPILLVAWLGTGWAGQSGELTIAARHLELQFDAEGRLVRAVACLPGCADANAKRIELESTEGLVGHTAMQGLAFESRVEEDDGTIELRFSDDGTRRLEWRIDPEGHALELTASGVGRLQLRSGEGFQPRDLPGFGDWLERVRYVFIQPDATIQVDLDDQDISLARGEWAGFRSRFWALLASSDRAQAFHIMKPAVAPGLAIAQGVEKPGGEWLIYLGPVEPRALRAVDAILPNLMYAGLWFWLRWICIALFQLLDWIQSVIPVWGLAIMALSVCVHVLMRPLSRLADRVQEQVHATEARLAPELERIRQQFRGEEQARRVLALYRSEGVHPLYSLKSLLGVAIVIPVFIGAFDMLAENIHLLNSGFLWIDDLSRPDTLFLLPFEVPFFGAGFNFLPVLMTGLSVWASRLHLPPGLDLTLRRRKLRNLSLLALGFFFLFYTFPAGMVLYWATNNLISVVKGLWAWRKAPRPA